MAVSSAQLFGGGSCAPQTDSAREPADRASWRGGAQLGHDPTALRDGLQASRGPSRNRERIPKTIGDALTPWTAAQVAGEHMAVASLAAAQRIVRFEQGGDEPAG